MFLKNKNNKYNNKYLEKVMLYISITKSNNVCALKVKIIV